MSLYSERLLYQKEVPVKKERKKERGKQIKRMREGKGKEAQRGVGE
jgi:hypothetical protein